MSIYAKLATARVELGKKGLKKTGVNRNFKYFELVDFLPEVNKIFAELKMCSVVSFTNELATLTIFDAEKEGDKIVITSPMVQRALPNGTDIQNLGAIQTYQRRYLYLTALEIAECDAVDCLDMQEQRSPQANKPQASKPKNNQDEIKQRLDMALAKCQSLEELDEFYNKQEIWIKQHRPDLLDYFNNKYSDMKTNFSW